MTSSSSFSPPPFVSVVISFTDPELHPKARAPRPRPFVRVDLREEEHRLEIDRARDLIAQAEADEELAILEVDEADAGHRTEPELLRRLEPEVRRDAERAEGR